MSRTAARTATLASLTHWITPAIARHGTALADALAAHLGSSRRKALHWLRQLEAAQWLRIEGRGRRQRFMPGALRQVVQTLPLAELDEARAWRRDFAPHFSLPPETARIVQHAFTELLNNAAEHSAGSAVTVSLRQTPLQVQLLVSDNGCGLFQRIASDFPALDEPSVAMLELAKGKLTSAPERHCGRGLFFTSRLADVFQIHANASAYQCQPLFDRPWAPSRALPAADGQARPGTSVFFSIAVDTPRRLDAVMASASGDAPGYGFDTTRVPLALLTAPGVGLASRADARRASARLADFARAELDFSGVPHIGHAFADELLRVIPRERWSADSVPTELVPYNAAPAVAAMLGAVTG
jgi:anti-sigma regulatory factor (Ser/Thr protein kinase)